MNTLFILFQSLHNLTQPRISKMWNNLHSTPYANFFALIGTALCVFATFMLIPADLAFFSLMAAVYWGSNPIQLTSQIEAARLQAHSIGGNSIGSVLDSVFNWIIQQISICPSAHMLAGNTIATLTMFFLVFIFITDVIWEHNFLPLQTQRQLHRIVLYSICITIMLCVSFYYVFVLVNGDHQKYNSEISAPQISQNIFDDSGSQSENVSPVAVVDNNQTMREVALGAYGIAMILSTALAVWGSSMYIRVVLTLVFLALLFIAKALTFLLIEIPYTWLGHSLGFMRLTPQQPPDNRNAEQNVGQAVGSGAQSANNAESSTDSTESVNQDNQPDTSNNGPDNEEERRILEEERNRIISKNPLGV